MTSPRTLNDILGKLNELRAVFTLGQRAVPFIEEVLDFLKEIAPLIEEIDSSMRESTGKMPGATSQLKNVTHQTELATNEILDLVDEVTSHLDAIEQENERMAEDVREIRHIDATIIRTVRSALKDQPEVLEKLDELHEEKKALRKSIGDRTQTHHASMEDIRSHVNRIMISLQVQDITAQQIASVNHLIESIRARMATLIERLDTTGVDPTPPSQSTPLANGPDFDANARYTHDPKRQSTVDEVFSRPRRQSESATSSVSQDDIDGLFQAANQNSGDGGSTEASQEEIDQLFS